MSYEQCPTTNEDVTIGLFGTCGNSNWREPFINQFKRDNTQWFNPNVKDWNPDNAVIEANHLVDDDIVLFPILGDELGTASLSETAFSVLRAMTERKSKFTVIFIEPADISLEEKFGTHAYKASRNARTIVMAHLDAIKHDHVYVAEQLSDMLPISILLHRACKQLKSARGYLNEK